MSHGTWQTTGSSRGTVLLAAGIGAGLLLGSGGAVAAVMGFLTSLVWVAGSIVLALIALAGLVAVLAYRRGWRPSLDPVVAYTPLPEPEPARALPAPEFHLHLHGAVTREQLDEVAALRETGYRPFDTDRKTS